jgi:uncharacterized protein (DUF3084 family)
MGTAFIILLLLALCGFIAYIGDLLGRRFGKKRLSVFGLRPKHTAIVLTIATGVLIAGVTFAAALATLPWFRNVVTQGEQLAYRNASLLRANEEAASNNRRLEESQKQLRGDNQRLQGTNQTLEQRNRELSGTNEKLRADSEKLKGRNTALAAANNSLAAANSGLREQATALKTQSSALREQNTGLRGANTRLAQSNRRLQQDVGSLKAQQERLTQVLEARRKEVDRLQDVANRYRNDQYIFNRHEPIEVLPIPRNPPRDVLRDLYDLFIYRVEKRAEAVRAEGTAEEPRVIYVRPEGYPFDRPRTASHIREWIVAWAAKQRDRDIVIRAVADENCVAERPVPVRIEWFVNGRVFSKGELITDEPLSVNGRASEGQILTELIFYLQGKVRTAAMRRQMVPNPEEAEFGSLWYDRLLAISRRVKEVNGPAMVVARARENINRTGPLKVDLEVIPLNDSLRSDAR